MLGSMLTRMLTGIMLASAALYAQAPESGFKADFLRQLADVEKKMLSLAQAMPQEKYSWRPGQGVRSVSEVFMHVAGGNFMLPNFAGVKPPAGIQRDMEKTVTEKGKVSETLKQSFEHVRTAIQSVSDADLDKPTKLFGRASTYREVYFLIANHMHEHLGQSIAYA